MILEALMSFSLDKAWEITRKKSKVKEIEIYEIKERIECLIKKSEDILKKFQNNKKSLLSRGALNTSMMIDTERVIGNAKIDITKLNQLKNDVTTRMKRPEISEIRNQLDLIEQNHNQV